MELHQAFTVPIFSHSIKGWTDHKEEIISLMDLDKTDHRTGRNYYTDYYKYHKQGIRPKYADKVFDLLEPVFDELDQVFDVSYTLDSMWAQNYPKGGCHELHNHGGLGYSAVLYVQLDETHLPTKFFSPFNDFWHGNLLEYIPNVKEGDIIFFPSVLAHTSPVVTSDKERIIISFIINKAQCLS